jgi:alginate O-acetyltransferase complex protein AlgI
MLFHDTKFLFIFLPIVFFAYFFLFKKKEYKIIFLILAGYIFYASWNIKFSPLILGSIIINYFLSKQIILEINQINKKKILICTIIFNIFYLGFFKYFDFCVSNINMLFDSDLEMLNLPFPLALSFVTFQTIAFLCDCYEGNIKKLDIKKYAIFIIFFPQLIAGPIVKYNSMINQFESKKNSAINFKNICIGLVILSIGIIKKVFIADNLSVISDQIFIFQNNLSMLENWLGSICFTFQIYFDFSGYIDMATGTALLFNIRLPQNFNSPFKSTGIIDFWQRWHITLSHFLRTYIYAPMLRSFKNINFTKSMFAVLTVFILAGLWHGPSWVYVIFGALHGIGLIINHTFRKYFFFNINKKISQVLTFLYVNFTFVFFRSENVDQALYIIYKMTSIFSTNNYFDFTLNLTLTASIAFIVSIIICFILKNSNWLIDKLRLSKHLD